MPSTLKVAKHKQKQALNRKSNPNQTLLRQGQSLPYNLQQKTSHKSRKGIDPALIFATISTTKKGSLNQPSQGNILERAVRQGSPDSYRKYSRR
jgi:hypothetical protein